MSEKEVESNGKTQVTEEETAETQERDRTSQTEKRGEETRKTQSETSRAPTTAMSTSRTGENTKKKSETRKKSETSKATTPAISQREETETAMSKSETGGLTGTCGSLYTRYHDKERLKTQDKTWEEEEEDEEEDRKSVTETTGHGGVTGRRVVMMRHAERLDRVFPGWTSLAFTETGGYRPYDLNQPLTLPKRAEAPEAYREDTPISEVGYVTAQMIGRGMRVTKLFFNAIYTSPALRCIQTGQGILKTLNTQIRMNVEPGLFEWLPWYRTMPRWLSMQEIGKAKYQVNPQYKPVMSAEDLEGKWKETPQDHYDRIGKVCKEILRRQKAAGPILIIGHGTTVDAGSRALLGLGVEDVRKESMEEVGTRFPYSCLAGMEETNSGKFTLISHTLPPISYLDVNNRMDKEAIAPTINA